MSRSNASAAEDVLLFDKHGGIAKLTLNRPSARNALTSALFLDMQRMLLEVASDDEVRVVVLTGAGRSFSAGADLKPVSKEERRRTEAPSFPGDVGGDILDRGNRCILRLRQLAKPVLGSINGDAVGIGCSLSHGAAKAAVYESANLPFASLLDFEARNQRAVSRSDDVKEGIRAFLERRKPEFRGR